MVAAKGAAIKFKSYGESVQKLLQILQLDKELKKYDKIVLKPFLTDEPEKSTSSVFTESVLQFCLAHKNPVAEIFIADGADGAETFDLFRSLGYEKLAEKYSVSMVDLNESETVEVAMPEFLKFSEINYPKILKESFVISLPKLAENEETEISGALSNMLGAFPASHYRGFFSKTKNKIRKWPIKYSVHDITKCKMPDLAVIDASEKGSILAGLPLEMDKRCAKILEKDWQRVPYIKLINEHFGEE